MQTHPREFHENCAEKSSQNSRAAQKALELETKNFPVDSFFQLQETQGNTPYKSNPKFIISDGPCRSETYPTTDAGRQAAARSFSHFFAGPYLKNLYIRVNPMFPPAGARLYQEAASDSWAPLQIATLIDIDPIKEDGRTSEEHIAGARTVADKILDLFEDWQEEEVEPYRPRLDFSGRGCQIILTHADLGAEAADRRRTLYTLLEIATGASSHGATIDPCVGNPSRLKRMLGSYNTRTKRQAVNIEPGRGCLSVASWESFIEFLGELTGWDIFDLEYEARKGGSAGLSAQGHRTVDRDQLDELPPLDEAEHRGIINAIRAAKIPPGRQHATRSALAGYLLREGIAPEIAGDIIWLGLTEGSDQPARIDSQNAVKTTRRRLAADQPCQGRGALGREIGAVALDRIHRAIGLAAEEEAEEAKKIPPPEPKSQEKPSRPGARKRIQAALQQLDNAAEHAAALAAALAFTGWHLGGVKKIFDIFPLPARRAAKEAAEKTIETIEKNGAQGACFSRLLRPLFSQPSLEFFPILAVIAAENDQTLGEFRAISRSNTSAGIHHYGWIEALTIEHFCAVEISDTWARKLRRIGRCGLFQRDCEREGKIISSRRLTCGDYACRFCASYSWEAAAWLDSQEHWPEMVAVLTVSAAADRPEEVSAAYERAVKSLAAPKLLGFLHPAGAGLAAGAYLVAPELTEELTAAGFVELPRREALDACAQRLTIRADRIRALIELRSESLRDELWLSAGRFHPIRQRGCRGADSGFFFPGYQQWMELRRDNFSESQGSDKPLTWTYIHAPTDTLIYREQAARPAPEHEIFWRAQVSADYHQAMVRYRPPGRAPDIEQAARRAAQKRLASAFAPFP